MLWFKKNAEIASRKEEQVLPGELRVTFDAGILEQKLQNLLDNTSGRGGVEAFTEALNKKHELFVEALNGGETIAEDVLEALLDTVFTARRKLPVGLSQTPHEIVARQIQALVNGQAALTDRLNQFADVFANDNRKVRGAAYDFGAELLHFAWPERYPLMCRWVWDVKTVSGSLREFIRNNDSLPEIPIGDEPEQYEAARVWMRDQLSERGYYRDLPMLIDLVMAQAYSDYVLAMSSGMGMMGGEFGGKMEPIDFIAKLLGVDTARRGGKSRVKKVSIH